VKPQSTPEALRIINPFFLGASWFRRKRYKAVRKIASAPNQKERCLETMISLGLQRDGRCHYGPPSRRSRCCCLVQSGVCPVPVPPLSDTVVPDCRKHVTHVRKQVPQKRSDIRLPPLLTAKRRQHAGSERISKKSSFVPPRAKCCKLYVLLVV
jgi:hypothetical protein